MKSPAKFRFLTSLTFIVVGPLISTIANSGQIDSHELFEERRGRCDQHAGAFARERLVIVEGRLRSRTTNRGVKSFLLDHSGNLNDAEAMVLVSLFRRRVASGRRIFERCGIWPTPTSTHQRGDGCGLGQEEGR